MSLGSVYGSKRGLVRHLLARSRLLFGSFNRARSVEFGQAGRVIFVCKGNICRSAFAEVVARASGVDAISCGIEAVSGRPANERAIEIAAEMGFDLSDHTTSAIADLDVRDDDIFVAMEPWHMEWLRDHYRNQVSLLGLWSRPARPYLHDPYGASSEYFMSCFELIKGSVDEITKKLG